MEQQGWNKYYTPEAFKEKELKLSDREWTCSSCGVVHDRDVNASRNILKEGLKIHRQGLSSTLMETKIRLL